MRMLEHCQIVPAIMPLDLQAALTGDVVSLKNYRHCTIVIVKGTGTDNDDQTFTLLQGTDIAFGTNKALSIISEYWEKEASDLLAVGTWTRVTQTAANTIVLADPSAQDQAVYVIEIDDDQLDADNGYDCIRISNDGAGAAAQLGCVLYLLSEPRYPCVATSMLSAIVD